MDGLRAGSTAPDERRRRRVAFFGGTFDPVHVGHLVAAQEAVAAAALDEVIFVPAADPPHKPGVSMAPAAHRVAMVEAAVAGNDSFRVGRFDVDRQGPHFTVDMLSLAIEQLGPGIEPFFLMGADSLMDLPNWRDPQRVCQLAQPIVAARPGYVPDMQALESAVPGLGVRVIFVDIPLIGIASSDIERRVAAGRPIRYQVPDRVEAYIRRHGLYTADS